LEFYGVSEISSALKRDLYTVFEKHNTGKKTYLTGSS
jgi:hypothetical protein